MTENEQTSIPNGKAGLIAKIKAGAETSHPETIQGIGDDAAVSHYDGVENTLVSSSIFAEGIHFDLTYTPLKHFGYKVVAASMSKILAMNAEPIQMTVSLAVSNKVMQQHILEFYDGVHSQVIGGDLKGATCTGACLLEEQSNVLALVNTVCDSCLLLCLQLCRKVKKVLDVL